VSPVPDPECVPCDFLTRCRAASVPRIPQTLVEVTRDGRMFENAVSGFDSGLLIRLHLRQGGSFEHATGLKLKWYASGRYRMKAVERSGRMVVGFVRMDCRACEMDFVGVGGLTKVGAERVGKFWRIRCRNVERRWAEIVTALVVRSVKKSKQPHPAG